VTCNCKVDHKLIDLFEEVFDLDADKLDEIEDSLLHSDAFHMLVDGTLSGEHDPYSVMADAIRCGIEVGRRLNEIRGLEDMVGFDRKYDKKRKVKKD
jgi:hypothetical protein